MGAHGGCRARDLSLSWPVEHLGTIDSTNGEARRRAKAGQIADSWLVAEVQTAGRGRLQRQWASPAGNLYATAFFHQAGGFEVAMRLPFAAALAVSDVVLAVAPNSGVRLKWPNDVRVNRAKISGILIETGQADSGVWIAAGMGVNVTHVPEQAGQEAICIADLVDGVPPSVSDVLDALRAAFATRLDQACEGFEQLREDWLSRAEGIGESVRVSADPEPLEGIFEGLDEDGGLILRLPSGVSQTIRAGDVELVRRI